jgi:hypothetical protein
MMMMCVAHLEPVSQKLVLFRAPRWWKRRISKLGGLKQPCLVFGDFFFSIEECNASAERLDKRGKVQVASLVLARNSQLCSFPTATDVLDCTQLERQRSGAEKHTKAALWRLCKLAHPAIDFKSCAPDFKPRALLADNPGCFRVGNACLREKASSQDVVWFRSPQILKLFALLLQLV